MCAVIEVFPSLGDGCSFCGNPQPGTEFSPNRKSIVSIKTQAVCASKRIAFYFGLNTAQRVFLNFSILGGGLRDMKGIAENPQENSHSCNGEAPRLLHGAQETRYGGSYVPLEGDHALRRLQLKRYITRAALLAHIDFRGFQSVHATDFSLVNFKLPQQARLWEFWFVLRNNFFSCTTEIAVISRSSDQWG